MNPNGPYTIAEAKALNQLGTRTGGCADCVDTARKWDRVRADYRLREEIPTQWKFNVLQQDPRSPHRFLCPMHFKKASETDL